MWIASAITDLKNDLPVGNCFVRREREGICNLYVIFRDFRTCFMLRGFKEREMADVDLGDDGII